MARQNGPWGPCPSRWDSLGFTSHHRSPRAELLLRFPLHQPRLSRHMASAQDSRLFAI